MLKVPSLCLKAKQKVKNREHMPCLKREALLLRSNHWHITIPKLQVSHRLPRSPCSHLPQPPLLPSQPSQRSHVLTGVILGVPAQSRWTTGGAIVKKEIVNNDGLNLSPLTDDNC